MKKYKVEVGGFVTVYRQRVITISAEDEFEAMEKAQQKFIDLQQAGSGSPICENGGINSIKEIK